MDISDLRLLELQAEALFTHDAAGRIVTINEPGGGGPAPRFFLGRTRAGNLWRVRHDLPNATARRLEELAASEPVNTDLRAEPRNMAAYLEALRVDGEEPVITSGPAYRFPDAPPPAPAGITWITQANLDLLRLLDWDLAALAAGELAGWSPMAALVEDGAAVSLGFSARLTEHVAEAGVNTLAAYRGLGYAPTVVAAWAGAILATGRIPLYSTSWDNLASQAVARKLGLAQYATDLSLR
jgi:RimJ/RimL family protein N-acetyltransferase